MKRSGKVRLLLLGGLSAGAIAGCAPAGREPRVSPESDYANDHHIPGAGYYHAPFHGFFPLPYNHYDAQRKLYFHGGQWSPAPHRSIVNVSAPSDAAARAAQAARTDIVRGGFGRSARTHHVWS